MDTTYYLKMTFQTYFWLTWSSWGGGAHCEHLKKSALVYKSYIYQTLYKIQK